MQVRVCFVRSVMLLRIVEMKFEENFCFLLYGYCVLFLLLFLALVFSLFFFDPGEPSQCLYFGLLSELGSKEDKGSLPFYSYLAFLFFFPGQCFSFFGCIPEYCRTSETRNQMVRYKR